MKKLAFVFILITLTIFISCSVGVSVFLVNNSEENYTVEAYFNRHINEINENRYLQLDYKDSVINIDKKTLNFLDKKLSYNIIDSSTTSFVLPKNSTLHFVRTSNHYIFLDSIKILEKNEIIKKDKFTRGKGTNFFYKIE